MDFAAYCASNGMDADTMDEPTKAAVDEVLEGRAGRRRLHPGFGPAQDGGRREARPEGRRQGAAEGGPKAARDSPRRDEAGAGIRAAVKKHGVTRTSKRRPDGKKVKVNLEAHAIEHDGPPSGRNWRPSAPPVPVPGSAARTSTSRTSRRSTSR
jgi:hypothetical protein